MLFCLSPTNECPTKSMQAINVAINHPVFSPSSQHTVSTQNTIAGPVYFGYKKLNYVAETTKYGRH